MCTTQLKALQAAKNKLLGQYALGKQTNAQIAQMFGWYETEMSIEFDTQFQQEIASLTAAVAQQAGQCIAPYMSLVGRGSR